MVIYSSENLFDSPKFSLLVHGCNAQGVWGSGIAKEFKKQFPKSFLEYEEFCYYESNKNDGETYLTTGKYFITSENIVCLITSDDYGKNVDNKETILRNTKMAIRKFLIQYKERKEKATIYSNKFNSGLFNVPWNETEAILKELVDEYNVNWVVCDPDLNK